MDNKCKICGKSGHLIYTNVGYRLVPLCIDCYKKEREKNANSKNKYKELIELLIQKGYIWILNVGDSEFPFTFFGLEIPFFQIIQYFFDFIDSDKYMFLSQDDFVFDFDVYSDPVIVETYIDFINEDDDSTYCVGIRMGKYDFEKDELLFFVDKQLGCEKSNLENYSSLIKDSDGELMEIMPDFEYMMLSIPELEEDEDVEYIKRHFDANDDFDDY